MIDYILRDAYVKGVIRLCAVSAHSTALIDLFLKPIFPVFGLLGIKSFWAFESILLVFLLGSICISTPSLFVYTM